VGRAELIGAVDDDIVRLGAGVEDLRDLDGLCALGGDEREARQQPEHDRGGDPAVAQPPARDGGDPQCGEHDERSEHDRRVARGVGAVGDLADDDGQREGAEHQDGELATDRPPPQVELDAQRVDGPAEDRERGERHETEAQPDAEDAADAPGEGADRGGYRGVSTRLAPGGTRVSHLVEEGRDPRQEQQAPEHHRRQRASRRLPVATPCGRGEHDRTRDGHEEERPVVGEEQQSGAQTEHHQAPAGGALHDPQVGEEPEHGEEHDE
jgi:hypothetical protein